MIEFTPHMLASLIKKRADDDYQYSDSRTGTDVDITRHGDTLVVVCQGSNEVKDWLTNFDVHPVDYHGIKVHHGYQRAHKRLVEFVDGQINDSVGVTHIIYTGHSAGGGIAQMLHVFHKSQKPSRCIVFASPKPFRYPIRNKFVELYINPIDIVPYLPLQNHNVNDTIMLNPGFYHGISGYIKRLIP